LVEEARKNAAGRIDQMKKENDKVISSLESSVYKNTEKVLDIIIESFKQGKEQS